MIQQQVALLEFDREKRAKFSPKNFGLEKCLPEKCVIAFFKSAVNEIAEQYHAEVKTYISSCTVNLPVYLLNVQGEEIALVCGFLGSAGAAAQLEDLIALGAKKFIVCGAAGTLTQSPVGALVIPDCAVRDEGASFHYAPPSYEIQADKSVIEAIGGFLQREELPFRLGKTWTTDALYRETEEKVALRREQGCITVEMEASALMAVAQFQGVRLGQILYCGDDLSGTQYDHRDFVNRSDIRRNMVELSLKCAREVL